MLNPSRFEHLALEYDSDDIGDLEDDEVGPSNGADVGEFGGLLDEFLAVHATPGHAHEGGQAYHTAAEAAAARGPAADEDAGVAIAKVCPGRARGGSKEFWASAPMYCGPERELLRLQEPCACMALGHG